MLWFVLGSTLKPPNLSIGLQGTRGYTQSLVGYFKQYTEWVKNSVSILPFFCFSTKITKYCSIFFVKVINHNQYTAVSATSHLCDTHTHPSILDIRFLCICILYVFTYVYLSLQLTAEVAQCKPISNIVDSMEIVGCSFIVDSVVRHQITVCVIHFKAVCTAHQYTFSTCIGILPTSIFLWVEVWRWDKARFEAKRGVTVQTFFTHIPEELQSYIYIESQQVTNCGWNKPHFIFISACVYIPVFPHFILRVPRNVFIYSASRFFVTYAWYMNM